MKIYFNILVFVVLGTFSQLQSQSFHASDPKLSDAYNLAINTVKINIRRGVLAAGGEYGGEWTRDIAINTWNGVSLLNPTVAERSLWSVTINKDTIGHQYWDRIIWVIAAHNHYKVTGNKEFLKQAYRCSVNSMKQQENSVFDTTYGLFKGPSVFNDGIAGYPEPIFDAKIKSSNVLDFPNTYQIKCLSTNAIYCGAYLSLIEMGKVLKFDNNLIEEYQVKANSLKANIRKYFYNEKEAKLYYLIDHLGNIDKSQEALGLSYSVIFGILNPTEALKITQSAVVSKYGITSVYPDFTRYSPEKPGRHNNIIWPMVNGFFARAAVSAGDKVAFMKEFNGLTQLALDENKGNYQFWEMFNPYTGKPDGGWQSDKHWASCRLQTWSATAYINMVHIGLMGMSIENNCIIFKPFLPEGISFLELTDLEYCGNKLNITIKGSGSVVKSVMLNGKKINKPIISSALRGNKTIVIELLP